jgi:hypothetical protein
VASICPSGESSNVVSIAASTTMPSGVTGVHLHAAISQRQMRQSPLRSLIAYTRRPSIENRGLYQATFSPPCGVMACRAPVLTSTRHT